jgi:hypothetical protein
MALSFALALFTILWPAAAAADPPSCIQDGPDNGAFVVELCLTVPSTTVSGNVTVSATVSLVSGSPSTNGHRVQRMVFKLDGQPLLTDYAGPDYEFTLPTQKWVDGDYLLEVEDMTRYIDPATGTNFVTDRIPMTLTFSNGNSEPPVNNNTFEIRTGTTPAPGQPLVVMATGDGASGEPGADEVADMIHASSPNLFLYLGDVYENGTYTEFLNWYGSDTTRFGRLKSITNPTVGNHEYVNGEAPGYFDYWDNIPNYYSYNAQGWHFVTLNSNSTFSELDVGEEQYEWLKSDLEANPAQCTVAYMHHPRFSIGTQGDTDRLDDVWRLLVAKGVDIVIGANDHNYQRWVPMDGDGQPSANGPTQFVVGTGGHGIRLFDAARTGDPRVVSKYDTGGTSGTLDARGALKLMLGATGATFEFVTTSEGVLDSGTIGCGSPVDTEAPVVTVPASITVNATSPAGATVTYAASATDNVDGNLTPTCNRASGATFPIGTTTVTCTATDAAGNSASKSFSVKVKSAAEQFADLIDKTVFMLKGQSLSVSLKASLQTAAACVIAKKKSLACAAMNLYIAGVKSLSGKKLTVAQVNELVADATRIKNVIGC